MIFHFNSRKFFESKFTFQIFEYSFAYFCFLLADGNRTVRTALTDDQYLSDFDRFVVDFYRSVVHDDLE